MGTLQSEGALIFENKKTLFSPIFKYGYKVQSCLDIILCGGISDKTRS